VPGVILFSPFSLIFFIHFVSLPSAPFLSLFSISVSCTLSLLPHSLLNFSALFCQTSIFLRFFHLASTSCWKLHDSAA
jgi:hypothetical protein